MKNITLIARVLISALFVLSAVAKLYPTPLYGITKVFEEGQLIPMGFSSDFAPFLLRLIIGFEFFIAIAILQGHYIKKLIIPSTILLITVFSIDLSIDIFGGVDENCGCFGQLIPMTPVEANIKSFTLTVSLVPFLDFDSFIVNILDKFFASISILSFPCFPVKVFAFFVFTNKPFIIFL